MTTIDEAREADRMATYHRGVRWGAMVFAFFAPQKGKPDGRGWMSQRKVERMLKLPEPWHFCSGSSLYDALKELVTVGILLNSYEEWKKSGNPADAFGGPDEVDAKGLPLQTRYRWNPDSPVVVSMPQATEAYRKKLKDRRR